MKSNQMVIGVHFVGFTSTTRDDWQRYFTEPVAPSNYKDLLKIQEFVAKAKEKQQHDARLHPLAGTLTSAVVLDNAGDSVLEVTSSEPGLVAAHLLAFLTANYPGGLRTISSIGMDEPLCGFDAKAMLRIMGMEALRTNAAKQTADYVSVRHWNMVSALDPFEAFLPAADRKDIDIFCLCDFLGVQRKFLPEDLETNAMAQAKLSRRLAELGFFYTHPEAAAR